MHVLHSLRHDSAWLLTKPKGIATGEFYITVRPAPYLDQLCTVFGRISDGQQFLKNVCCKLYCILHDMLNDAKYFILDAEN